MSFTKEEKIFIEITDRNIQHFNANKRKGKLSIEYVVDGGNRALLYCDGALVLNLTIEQAWAAVAGITRYEEARND